MGDIYPAKSKINKYVEHMKLFLTPKFPNFWYLQMHRQRESERDSETEREKAKNYVHHIKILHVHVNAVHIHDNI